jgi:hypothetical protein
MTQAEEQARMQAEADQKATDEADAKLKAEADRLAMTQAEEQARIKAEADTNARDDQLAKSTADELALMNTPPKSNSKIAQTPARMVLKSVKIDDSRPNGGKWDNGSDADLRVQINTAKWSWTSPTSSNQNSTTFNKEIGTVSLGDTFNIEVLDEDLFLNDSVGSTRYQITEKELEAGSIQLKFGSVESLMLEFKR